MLKNTIIAGNWDGGGDIPDCRGGCGSYGYNVIGDMAGCTLFPMANPGTDKTGVDPLLGPLADNGGPTLTHALLPGSPAIDDGSCTDIEGNPVTTDQRGQMRPLDGNEDGMANCDIGAYEFLGYPGKMHYAQRPDSTGWDVFSENYGIIPPPPNTAVADDWLCTETGPITEIRFWGSWLDGVESPIDYFSVAIFPDIPADESPTGYSMPGDEPLWVMYAPEWDAVPIEQEPLQGFYIPSLKKPILYPENHSNYVQYTIPIPSEAQFVQEEGTIYWLMIVREYGPHKISPEGESIAQPLWGWKTSRDHWNDAAVWTEISFPGSGKEGNGLLAFNLPFEWHRLFDPYANDSLDMAFVIYGGGLDADGDAVPDLVDGYDDRDGDGIPNHLDYDPTGYFYDEETGQIIPGGNVSVSGPGIITLHDDGSSGYYRFTTFIPMGGGIYTLVLTLPPNTSLSGTCLRQDPPAFDPTGGPDPTVLGTGEDGSTGFLTSDACTDFYLTFDLEPGDPFIINNNIPLQVDRGAEGFDGRRGPCYPDCSGHCCWDHGLDGQADDYLVGPTPGSDLYAVGFYNPCGEARLDTVSFQWFDPGIINMWIYVGLVSPCEPCVPLELDASMLESPPLDFIEDVDFIGNWMWEKVIVSDSCIIIPPKRCFYVVWQQAGAQQDRPRILGDAGHDTTYSWIWNAELNQWKCFPGYEYMVQVCLDYDPGCLDIDEPDITWSHPYRDEYPCVCDDYTVKAAFHNECETAAFVRAAFFEAPWGLFMLPGMEPQCVDSTFIVGGGIDTLFCECGYHHHPDDENWWARNTFIAWSSKRWISTGACVEDTVRAIRRCRMTIWPENPWDHEPVKWGLKPIVIPVWNDTGIPMTVEVSLEDVPAAWDVILSEALLVLQPVGTPGDRDSVYVTVWPEGAEPEGPVIMKVKGFKCSGEWGEVEIEFMPYPKHFYVGPDGRPVPPVRAENIRWNPRYPCESGPYDVWATVVNEGSNSAYPKISFGLAPWGFFVPAEAVYDTVLWGGIGGGGSQVVAPYHGKMEWFVYGHFESSDYEQYARNIVIDYPVMRHHCPNPDSLPETWTVEDSTTAYLRDCEMWLWSKHRWVSEESTWAPVVIQIPVHNEEPYEDCITLWIEQGDVPPSWDYFFDETVFCLEPEGEAQTLLTIFPKGSEPPTDLPAHVIVHAAKGFCDRDTDEVDIKFMPFTGMCIRDTSGVKVTYKHSNCGGEDPTVVPGDTVDIGLMLDNEYPVSAVQINLSYDAAYLNVVDVAKTARTSGFELVWLSPPGGGLVEIALFSTPEHPQIDPLPAGEGFCEMPPGYAHEGNLSIVRVFFKVLPEAPAGTCADIVYASVILDGLDDWSDPPEPKEPLCLKFEDKGQICFGGYLVPGKCDVTGPYEVVDTMVTLVDLYAILYHIVGRHDPPLTGPVTSPGTQLWAADANGDTLVNIIDLMKCINIAVGVCDPKAAVADVAVDDVMGLAGRRVAVPAKVTSEADVAGVLLRFRYDRSVLEAGAPELTDRSEGMAVSSKVIGDELVVFVSSLTGEVIEAGTGSVVRVPFQVSGKIGDEIEVEVVEPVVFTADERIVFGQGSLFVVKVGDFIPMEYSLAQNYPNPFNPVTSIPFGLPEDARVRVTVYNILGQLVTDLVDDELEAGYHVVRWDGEQAASGVYFYRIEANGFTSTRRMVLMK